MLLELFMKWLHSLDVHQLEKKLDYKEDQMFFSPTRWVVGIINNNCIDCIYKLSFVCMQVTVEQFTVKV